MNPHYLKITLSALSVATIGLPILVGWSATSAKTPSATVVPTAQTLAQSPEVPATDPTLKNLQTAYNGESNAHVMYLAYAEKADQEGYKGVGSLFRAAARSEAIHQNNHAKVIEGMEATPENKINTPVVQTTSLNLEQGIKGESYESETMYPQFIQQAKAENNEKAVQTFDYAWQAEQEHMKLFTEAKDNLAEWQEPRTFYVCSVSGYTTMSAAENDCLVNDVQQPVEEVR